MRKTILLGLAACAYAAAGEAPRINGPTVYGVRPGSPIIYRLPVTGTRPLALEAKGLPPGVTFDAAKGILGGAATARGTNEIAFTARNAEGTATKRFRLVVGDRIALTPPMGFNTFGGLGGGPMMNEANVRKSFRALIDKGLVDHGYAYCNLDDGWQGERGGARNALQPNSKFGDMKRLFDDMHAEGLKAGIYSTPWGTSYQYLPGGSSDSPDGRWDGDTSRKTGWRVKKYMFDVQDIGQFAEWGCDYFKYDWSMGEKPHQPGLPHVYYAGRIAAAIAAQPRDIVLELSNAAPFGEAWNFTQLGNMTRTGSDLVDIWSHASAAKKMKIADWAMGILDTMDKVRRWQPYNRPGHWNMPCPTRVGMLGGWDEKPLAPSRLTKDEQVTHISLWCLWSAPIIIGCPIDLLDDWTLALLTNDEMLDLDQDALGVQAVDKDVAGGRILVKPLENGDVAVGFVNVGDAGAQDIAVTWAEAGLSGPCAARDLWRHADLGVFDGAFTARGVPPHGCRVVRFSRRPAPPQGATAPAGLASAIPDAFEEMVPMPDGTRLYTCATRPPKGEKRPILVMRSPYAEKSATGLMAFAMISALPHLRGYACVFQHCRGCGQSEGSWVPYESERADGLALLDWIRARPWYNGEIFLVGGSYHSAAHWAYLDTNPPDVKGAVLPTHGVNRYHTMYRNGVFKIGLFESWTLHFYRRKDRSLKRDRSVRPRDFPLCDFARRYWGVEEPVFDNILAHPLRDDPFWLSDEPGAGGSMRNAFSKSTMPILLMTSAYDMFMEDLCNMWRETPRARLANCTLIVDAYDHEGRCRKEMKGTLGEFPGGERTESPARVLDWIDACRAGRSLAFAPPGKVRYYALWENRWIEADTLADGPRRVDIPLGTGTRRWTYDPLRPPPRFPGACGNGFDAMRTQPPPDFRDDVASFVLPPAAERLDVRGRMRARLAVTSDCEDTCFYVRLSVRKPDGKWYLLRDDVTTLSANGGDYVPGSERLVEFRFADLAFRLEKGDAMRVDVASASPHFAPHGNVKGNPSEVRKPKVAHNAVRAEASVLTLFAN